MKDLETLYKIGETNAFGEKERRRVPFFIVADYLDDRYVKTKNEVYNKIADLYIERSHKMLGCWLLFGMSSTIAFAIYNWPL
jgi:hypothetical protein